MFLWIFDQDSYCYYKAYKSDGKYVVAGALMDTLWIIQMIVVDISYY